MGRNTKAYLVSLLLLFLLAHTSVAARISIQKFDFPWLAKIKKLIKNPDEWAEYVTKLPDAAEEIIDHLPDAPPPFAPQPEIKSERYKLMKEYLNSYGYFPDSDNFTGVKDDQLISSVKDYQKFFNFNVNGNPDDKITRAHMSLLRCGVPDKNFTYDLSTDMMSWPLGTQWFPNGRKNLTYGFVRANKLSKNVTKVFADSFKRWSDAITVVNLTETKYEDADIKIEFIPLQNATESDANRTEVVGVSFIGMLNGNKGNGSNVTFGAMVLDDSKYMVLPSEKLPDPVLSLRYGVVDLETVVMHQIGHLLGLQHSSHEESVMYPSILPTRQRKVSLSNDDKEQINKVYFSTSSSTTGSGSGCGVTKLAGSFWGLVTTTLSLGLACLLLFFY